MTFWVLPGFSDRRTVVIKAIPAINSEHRKSALTPSHRLLANTMENAWLWRSWCLQKIRLACYINDWLANWLTDSLTDLLSVCLSVWLTDRSFNWATDRLILISWTAGQTELDERSNLRIKVIHRKWETSQHQRGQWFLWFDSKWPSQLFSAVAKTLSFDLIWFSISFICLGLRLRSNWTNTYW